MAFEVQDSDAPTETANSYLSVADWKQYCDDRGYDYSALTDTQIEQGLVRATDYADSRWIYAGVKYDSYQSTEAPRSELLDANGVSLDYFPRMFLNGISEYAKVDLIDQKTLMPNSQDNTQSGLVTYDRRKVGEVEKEFHYYAGRGFIWPVWPLADKLMRQSGLFGLNGRRQLSRG